MISDSDSPVIETSSLVSVDQAQDLTTIHRPDCAAAIWRRPLDAAFRAWIDALDPTVLPGARIVLKPSEVGRELRRVCAQTGTPASPHLDWFVEDVASLATEFARITDAPHLRLRLDVVTSNACRRFHVDALTVRLICTYRGTGTQYGFADPGGDPRHISTVPTGSPILLRGSRWPETPESGLLHRSPPIEGSGETRLLLVLDPLIETEDRPHKEAMP